MVNVHKILEEMETDELLLTKTPHIDEHAPNVSRLQTRTFTGEQTRLP